MTQRIHVCTTCGSPRVYADAWVSLNDPDDVQTYDDTHCNDCEGECRTNLVNVPDEFDIDTDFFKGEAA